jgi:hypothetical protein
VVDEHAGATGVLECVELQLRVLIDGRDAGVADKRAVPKARWVIASSGAG